MQQPSNANVKALNVLEAAFRAFAREEGRGPFELKTKPVIPYDPATTLDLIRKTAEALKSAVLRRRSAKNSFARHREWAQAAIDSAERRTAEAERLANDVEEKAEKWMAFLMLIQQQLQKAQ